MTEAAFALFIAGSDETSRRAAARLEHFCTHALALRTSILVVDVTKSPEAAEINGVGVTPTVVKHAPGSVCRIVGEWRDEAELMSVLQIPTSSRAAGA